MMRWDGLTSRSANPEIHPELERTPFIKPCLLRRLGGASKSFRAMRNHNRELNTNYRAPFILRFCAASARSLFSFSPLKTEQPRLPETRRQRSPSFLCESNSFMGTRYLPHPCRHQSQIRSPRAHLEPLAKNFISHTFLDNFQMFLQCITIPHLLQLRMVNPYSLGDICNLQLQLDSA